jgi:hypothetical protein
LSQGLAEYALELLDEAEWLDDLLPGMIAAEEQEWRRVWYEVLPSGLAVEIVDDNVGGVNRL